MGAVAGGATKTFIFPLTAGSPGTKTFRAFVDSGCSTSETSESNNQTTKSYTVVPLQADLVLLNLNVTRPYGLDGERTFTACSFDIKNNGPSALSSEGVFVEYYLSNDTTFGDSDDKKIGDTGFTFSIASGATTTVTLTSEGLANMVRYWTQCLVPNGNYYVFAKVSVPDGSPSDPTSSNNYTRTGSTFIYNGCTFYGVTITSCTINPTTACNGATVTLSGTGGQVRGMSNSDLIKVTIGLRNSSGNWVGGNPVVVSSTVPGLNWQAWSGSSASITAPTSPGTYYVWVRSTPTTSDSTAINDFKTATPTSANEERDDKWSTSLTVEICVDPPPPPTVLPADNITSTGFRAKWNSSSGATGYRLDVATNSSFTSYVSGYQNRDVGDTTSHPVSGLTANTPYWYRVRAYNSAGTSGNSDTIPVTTSNDCVGTASRTINGTCVTITVTPCPGTSAWGLEETLSVGLTPADITGPNGNWNSSTRKITWYGTGDSPATCGYCVSCPGAGSYTVSGTANYDGTDVPVSGPSTITCGGCHPADTNNNWVMTMSEAIAYAAGWQQGLNPMNYAIRALYLWQNCVTYERQPGTAEPMCWVCASSSTLALANESVEATVNAGAVRTVSNSSVSIVISPPVGTSAWGYEEIMPAGLTPANIAGPNGNWNATTRKITWYSTGAASATLGYTVAGPDGVYILNGAVNFDGADGTVTGDNQVTIGTQPTGEAVRSVSDANVSIVVSPAAGTSAWGLEESIPAGLTPSNITGPNGNWNAGTRKITWYSTGVASATLGYTVAGPDGVYTLNGTANFDGTDHAVTGDSQVTLETSPIGGAVRSVTYLNVSIAVTPPVGTSAWGYEEIMPAGLTPANIAGPNGNWNAATRKITWYSTGAAAVTLTYTVNGPAGVYTLDGTVNFDGQDNPVTAEDSQITIDEQCVEDADCDDGDLCTIDACVDGECVNTPVQCPEGEVCDPDTGQCVVPPLSANAGPDKSICLPGTGSPTSAVLDGSATGGTPPYTYFWETETGLDDPDVAEPTASPSSTTTYTLTVTDDDGTIASDTVKVTVNDCTPPRPDCTSDAQCNDNNLCTNDTCVGGHCVYTPIDCPDGEVCDPDTGECIPGPCSNDADCDDDDLCTTGACVSGACVYEDMDCGEEICDPDTGACVECLEDADCDDGQVCEQASRTCVDVLLPRDDDGMDEPPVDDDVDEVPPDDGVDEVPPTVDEGTDDSDDDEVTPGRRRLCGIGTVEAMAFSLVGLSLMRIRRRRV
ncbi:MAG: fibronectin type III domain-containing protein [Phycisphaerales bacterium]|nr:fibronectin type III domain-containing protein [Phycisphaerales bacterium]